MKYFEFLNYIKTVFRFFKRHIMEGVFSLLLLTLLGFILIPGILEVHGNGAASKCRQNMNLISFFLESELNNEYLDFDWTSVLYQKRSQRILDAVKEYSDSERLKKMDTSEYYFTAEGSVISLKCRYHDKNEPIEIEIPEKYQNTMTEEKKTAAEPVGTLTVTGIRTYIKGEQLDVNDPEKMVFTSSDDLKSIFDDIIVTVQYIGGQNVVLDKSAYELSTDGFDMSVPGKKNIAVTYTVNNDWNNTLRGFFSFEVLENSMSPEFIVNFGDKGSYKLAAWDWSDYVRDAMAGEADEMEFDASIVYYDGKYLYYPDGFTINKLRDNTDPLTGAADRDDNVYSAYSIRFDPNTIIGNPDDEKEMSKIHDGAMMMDENEDIYIWQVEPSKEVDAGWLRVYCEVRKN